jgi:thioredoxin 1
MSDIQHLKEENWEATTGSGALVIDFYADWCGPCKMMAPAFEEAAGKYEGKIVFAKVNIDEQRKLAVANKVMSIPTLLFFKNGEVADRVVGVIDEATLTEKLNALL